MDTVNQKKAKAARRVAQVKSPSTADRSSSFLRSWKGALVGLGVVALVAGSFVIPKLVNSSTPSAGAEHAMSLGAEQGAGLPVGSPVPQFEEQDVVTGKAISSRSLYPHKTLLFFSEGVMCQACFQQIKGLEQFGADLKKRSIQLVSITPDSPGELRQAIGQYGITTPMISDQSRAMSSAFNTLGKGMHADTPGHAFALIDKGRVVWYRDYWLSPDETMYVAPEKLLADIPA